MEESKTQEPQQPSTVNTDEQPDNTNHDAVQPPKPKSKKKWLWTGLAMILVAAGLGYWFLVRDEPQASINSYDECVAAGYPVMESYPEQCAVPGGQTFTRQLSEEEQAALDESMPDEFVVEDCTESEVSKEPITLDAPTGWSKKAECFKRDGGEPTWLIYITSPDYKYSNDASLGMGGGGVINGTEVVASIERIESLQSSYNSTESILDGTAESKSSFENIKAVTVGEYKGVEYMSFYEGPGSLINKFDIDGYEYSFAVQQNADGSEFTEHLDEYKAIVQSFKVN